MSMSPRDFSRLAVRHSTSSLGRRFEWRTCYIRCGSDVGLIGWVDVVRIARKQGHSLKSGIAPGPTRWGMLEVIVVDGFQGSLSRQIYFSTSDVLRANGVALASAYVQGVQMIVESGDLFIRVEKISLKVSL